MHPVEGLMASAHRLCRDLGWPASIAPRRASRGLRAHAVSGQAPGSVSSALSSVSLSVTCEHSPKEAS